MLREEKLKEKTFTDGVEDSKEKERNESIDFEQQFKPFIKL